MWSPPFLIKSSFLQPIWRSGSQDSATSIFSWVYPSCHWAKGPRTGRQSITKLNKYRNKQKNQVIVVIIPHKYPLALVMQLAWGCVRSCCLSFASLTNFNSQIWCVCLKLASRQQVKLSALEKCFEGGNIILLEHFKNSAAVVFFFMLHCDCYGSPFS